jgi:hypothetical protein
VLTVRSPSNHPRIILESSSNHPRIVILESSSSHPRVILESPLSTQHHYSTTASPQNYPRPRRTQSIDTKSIINQSIRDHQIIKSPNDRITKSPPNHPRITLESSSNHPRIILESSSSSHSQAIQSTSGRHRPAPTTPPTASGPNWTVSDRLPTAPGISLDHRQDPRHPLDPPAGLASWTRHLDMPTGLHR